MVWLRLEARRCSKFLNGAKSLERIQPCDDWDIRQFVFLSGAAPPLCNIKIQDSLSNEESDIHVQSVHCTYRERMDYILKEGVSKLFLEIAGSVHDISVPVYGTE